MIDGLYNGVKVGRPAATEVIDSPNWPSALLHKDQVTKIIIKDLQAGRTYGPFDVSPYDKFVVSPLGAIPKPGSDKIRVIHDLSFPPTRAVNDLIDPDDYSLSYSSIDDAIVLINSFVAGSCVHLAKLDLQDAFKHVFVSPEDWHLLGFAWPDSRGKRQFYFSKVLNFGLRSSPALFDRYAAPLLDIMVKQGASTSSVRYVDDFLTIAPSKEACQDSLDIMLRTCHDAGFSVQPSKVTSPARAVTFLGIEINAAAGIISLPHDKLVDIRALLAQWIDVKSLSKRQLLRILGKLNFAARVIRGGRAFTGRLINAAKSTRHLHFRVRLTHEARMDLRWWYDCLSSHNGVSFFPRAWSSESSAHIFTDASDVAVAGVWGSHWFSAPFVDGYTSYSDESINWRELIAVVLAINTWGPQLQGRNVILHIDNTAVCHLVHKMYTPSTPLMALLRVWALLIEKYSINHFAVYIPTKENVDADDLSRNRVDDFRRRNPHADPNPTPLDELPRYDLYL